MPYRPRADAAQCAGRSVGGQPSRQAGWDELSERAWSQFTVWVRVRTRSSGFRAVQKVPGVGPILAAIFVAEIGDVTRFASPAHLSSWAGLTPKHRESDTVVRRGPITKQGSTLVRWAAVEAAKGARNASWLDAARARIVERRGRNIATVAVARKLLTYVFYGLRDGHIRALEQTRTAA